jgi:hypothetical protein
MCQAYDAERNFDDWLYETEWAAPVKPKTPEPVKLEFHYRCRKLISPEIGWSLTITIKGKAEIFKQYYAPSFEGVCKFGRLHWRNWRKVQCHS